MRQVDAGIRHWCYVNHKMTRSIFTIDTINTIFDFRRFLILVPLQVLKARG